MSLSQVGLALGRHSGPRRVAHDHRGAIPVAQAWVRQIDRREESFVLVVRDPRNAPFNVFPKLTPSASHHLILPGTKTTSTSSFYTVSYMKIPADKQDEAAAAIEAYLASPGVGDGLDSVCFAASREDPDMIVCLSGHLNAEIVEEMRKASSPEGPKQGAI